MKYDENKVDEVVLALLFLTKCDDHRAWKCHDWDALNRLYEKDLIGNPKSKSKSVVLTEKGLKDAERLFAKFFSK